MKIQLNKIIQGDSFSVLKTLPDESIDMCITSPPYFGLRIYLPKGHPDYKKQIGLESSFDEFQNKLLAVISEVKRVLKKSGSFWLNMGDCYGGVKIGKTDKKVSDYVKDAQNGLKKDLPEYEKCLMMMPERIALKMIDDGWILRNKIKWAKQVLIKKKGKTIGSVMPTSVKDRFNESGEELYFFVKSKKYYFDLDAVRLPNQTLEDRPMGIDREKNYPNAKRNKFAFNYRVRDAKRKAGQPQFKASEEEIKRYMEPNKQPEGRSHFLVGKQLHDYYKERGIDEKTLSPQGKNIPTIWQIGTEPHNFQRETGIDTDHFATFPEALVEIPILAGCPKNGIVLDCFGGSGTVGVVAKKLGRNYILIDLSEKYCRIAEARIKATPVPLL